jgi:FkbH-like protein
MSDSLYANLSWLPAPPADFSIRCRAIEAAAEPGQVARALAGHALDSNQLARLGRVLIKLQEQRRSLVPLDTVRLGLVGNGTLEVLAPALVATAARYGFALECVVAGYGQIMQEALDPSGRINAARVDEILLAIDYRGLPMQYRIGEANAERVDIDATLGWLDTIRDGFHRNAGATVIVPTFAHPPETLFGSYDGAVYGTPRRLLAELNQAIVERLRTGTDRLLDVAQLAETVGVGEWHSPALWNMGKLPFDETFLGIYAEHVLRLLAAARGRSRKCLILDLDNTVWGGVIGDDGVEGIRIALGDETGEAFLDVQRLALALRQRGIVLAVSSKNTDEIARAPFRHHADMLLREEHFAVFQANWNDKATNIKAIAEELSLGLDAMVFLDDNPAERALVRQFLPQVAVPELPDDPALYARTLAAAGYFEAILFSDEDRKRAGMYEANARRASLLGETGDIEGFLTSLEMEISFAPFDDAGRARISQLINKSNQFNLTTRRYSEAEVEEAAADAAVFTLQVRLRDKFGDNGMISVVICRPRARHVWELDVWLMSCRVLGRRVEEAVLGEIVRHARAAGIDTLIGRYLPTARNDIVKDHYMKLGFALDGHGEDGSTTWSLSTRTQIPTPRMSVRRTGFA